MKKTKKPKQNHCCGHCALKQDVIAGRIRLKITFGCRVHSPHSCACDPDYGPYNYKTNTKEEVLGGVKRWATQEEAVEHLTLVCQRTKEEVAPKNRVVVPEIRREGQRILKAGTNVSVQLKRKSGTKRDDAFVMECYDDNHVRLYVDSMSDTVTVPADEFVKARRGSTRVL
tara:strand:+ start:3780 stop:4292 length:513 start_codon:yes stop_codon:yes gene_type:complete